MARDRDQRFDHNRHTLGGLGRQPGTPALIFGKAQNKFQAPAKLRRVPSADSGESRRRARPAPADLLK